MQIKRMLTLGAGILMAYMLVGKSAHLSAEWWLWWSVMVALVVAFIVTTEIGDDGTHYSEVMEEELDGTNGSGRKDDLLHDHGASRHVGA